MNRHIKYAAYGMSVFIFLYMLFMATITVTGHHQFCNKCHIKEPYVASWQNSPHREVSCTYCHQAGGYLGKLNSFGRRTNNFYLWLTNQDTILTYGKVFERNCIVCHMGDNRKFLNATRLNNEGTNHYEIIKNRRSCLECHAEVGHETRIWFNPEFENNWE